jgi:hypothetical protein
MANSLNITDKCVLINRDHLQFFLVKRLKAIAEIRVRELRIYLSSDVNISCKSMCKKVGKKHPTFFYNN